ncbi:MAG TPA: HAD-IA family hydrolase [Rhizomicrobium sp.]|jgi:HAD superfamily hydrolase (TIGR01509 family)|nr:HAD-IA family hydrolase [Rhizomicrobium sp.]
MAQNPISALIFDCDGVLVDSEILAHEVEIATLAEFGLDYDLADFRDRFMGMSNKAFYAALDDDARARLGRSIMPDVKEIMHVRYYEIMRTRLQAVPGVLECVANVRQTKAVASSSTAEGLDFKLKKTGLWDHFAPHVYSADHVTHSKPAPDLFLHAAAALGVNPAHCLVIEDSVNGVLAARAAGMMVWGFGGGAHMDGSCERALLDAGAARFVGNWTQAGALIAGL